jgi:NAD(P)-dependent dehydrogenase (short-subunit alcohol dehydrogenase family)
VVFADLDGAAADEAAGATGDRARGVALDVTDSGQCDAAMADVVAAHGRLDYLIRAAGILSSRQVRSPSSHYWTRMTGNSTLVRVEGLANTDS